MVFEGNRTDLTTATAKPRHQSQQQPLFEGGTRPSDDNIEKGKGAADGAEFFTILPEKIMMADMPLKQKVALAYLLKQAYYQGGLKDIKVSNSTFMRVLSIAKRDNLYLHIEALITAGYVSKSVVTYGEGVITAYTLNINKIEKDFGFKVKTIYKNWKNN